MKIKKQTNITEANYKPAMQSMHSFINLVNLDSPGARAEPVSNADLAVWYSSSFMHAMLHIKTAEKGKSIGKIPSTKTIIESMKFNLRSHQ